MFAYRLSPGAGIDGLALQTLEARAPQAREVKVRVRAVSLNYRDLMIARNGARKPQPAVIPCSDGAGEVIEVGTEVTRFRPGDRVMAAFFPRWIEGEATPDATSEALGGNVDGMLAEERFLHEDTLVRMPEQLSFAEAACLPCAGVTAWNALFVTGRLEQGDSVLLLGTGGVSILALQLSTAAGLRSSIISSSDDKLEQARTLGATYLVNYRTTPDWDREVRSASGGGVDLVVEVGGADTLKRSIGSSRMGGTVAIVGGVSGFEAGLDTLALVAGSKRLVGICVGSRAMLEDLSRFIQTHGIQPKVDRTFPFAEAPAAYRYLEKQGHFGKVVISLDA